MRTLSLLLLFTLGSLTVFSQDIRFKKTDQKMLLLKGDLVTVDVDTAYIISKSRADLLNEKLDELSNARKANSELKTVNNELLSKVKEVEKLVSKLLVRMEKEGGDVQLNLEDILNQLNSSLETLKSNNRELAKNNDDLKKSISVMDATIDKLKKEVRGIWWNGVADKVVTGLAGFGIGLIVGIL